MQRFGIDISKWQGDFNVTEAKNEGVQFAIIKIGGGDNSLYGDKKFEENYSKFKEAGIPIGCYFYGNAKTISEAKKEADYWMFLMDNHSFELPVFYDVEGSMLNNTPRVLTDIILTVCGTLYNSGYAVGVYASESVFNNKFLDEELGKFYHWVAKWSTNNPTLKSGNKIDIWQFGGETNLIRSNKIAGVTCDQDYCYIEDAKPVEPVASAFQPYLIQAKTPMNVRSGAGVENKIVGQIDGKYKYTIVDEAKASDGGTWGYLKSGMGWINVGDKYVNKFSL